MQDAITFSGEFSFDDNVSSCFDDMLSRSVPDYDGMRKLVYGVGSRFVNEKSTILALGSSLGRDFEQFAKDGIQVVSVDVSEPMIARQLKTYENYENVKVLLHDITRGLPDCSPDLVLCVLTLQFIPIEHRQGIIREVNKVLNPGGAFIVVEKVLGRNAFIDDVLVGEYYKGKFDRGYSKEQVYSKRNALQFKMAPLPFDSDIQMLKDNGFGIVECFWRNLNFAAFLCIKG